MSDRIVEGGDVVFAVEPPVQAAAVTAFGAIVVALIGAVLEMLRRSHKQLGAVQDQVQNSHGTNLRDDLDQVLAGQAATQELVRHEIHRLRADVREDMNGIRAELLHERQERLDLERRFDGLGRRGR